METVQKLSPRQQRFVAEYLVDLNQTQAAIRAGYAPKTARNQAARLMANVNIQDAIQKARQKREIRTEIRQDQVLQELARIAFADYSDFVKVAGGKVMLTDTDRLKATQRAALSQIEDGPSGVKLKLYDKLRALELIGKHLGMFDRERDDGDGTLRVELPPEAVEFAE